MATRTEAMKPKDLARVVVDTTVQPKAVMFPTDAKLLNRARERLVRFAAHVGVELRQLPCAVGGKLARSSINAMPMPIVQARQQPARCSRPIWAASSVTSGGASTAILELEEIFARPLSLSWCVLAQDQRQRGLQGLFPACAPEVEWHRSSGGHRLYEFGGKGQCRHDRHRSKGGQFVTCYRCLSGNPYDGHTLATVIPAMEDMIGNTIERLTADAGYRATMRQSITSSGSIRQAKSAGSHRRST